MKNKGMFVLTIVIILCFGLGIAPGEDFTIASSRNNLTNSNITVSDEKITIHFANN